MHEKLFPVVLAGGSGTRLWPLSRHHFPKQFLNLRGEYSLLQQTMQRLATLHYEEALVVTNEAHYFLCQEQLEDFAGKRTFILEPAARNTAPALAAAAHYIENHAGPEALMLVLPSDHWIADEEAFIEAIELGQAYATAYETLVVFGVKPDSPQTAYGYIELGDKVADQAHQVTSFTEKPNETMALKYLAQGRYLWNAGILIGRARVFLDELQKHAQAIHQLAKQALLQASTHHDFLRLHAESFLQCESTSIDYAVLEKTDKRLVVPISMGWNDLGSWASVAEINEQDEKGNTLVGKVLAKDSQNCFIHSQQLLVTTLGLQDQMIIATKDAVLVAHKSRAEQVKELVGNLSLHHQTLLQEHQRVFRPWGYYEILAEGPAFKVKRLMVKPKAKLSLQIHQHRAEHWVVIGGIAEVVNADQVLQLNVNQSTYIPQNTKHRLSNPFDEPLYVIEVQTGSYLGEDDILRIDDIYARTHALS